ncbi:MAG TPA: MFS transporter [Candidatus Obscuribacterales bacterium]
MNTSVWRPLRKPLFRAFWLAALVSNIGTWMHDVGAAWLMTSLTTSPLMVALMQTAVYLPFFLMALPSGAMADVFDKRKLLLFGQLWMLVSALALAGLSFCGAISPWILLLLTFALGLGAAVSAPAWNAVTPELVARPQLQGAIALSGVSFNLSRGVGSVIGGIIVALFGSPTVFLLNAVSFVGLVLFFLGWRRKPKESFRHAERVTEAMRAGIRYVRHAPELTSVLMRSALFSVSSSAFWALLPLVCRQKLGFSAYQYGLALGLFGLGTLLGAFFLPKLRARFSLDYCVAIGTASMSFSIIGLVWAQNFVLAGPFMIFAGTSFLLVNSCLNLAVQVAVPVWVRARALAFFILVCQGSVALGSILWGSIASQTGLVTPLLLCSLTLLMGLIAIRRHPLVAVEQLDVSLSRHWDQPRLAIEPEPTHGPVLVTVEYIVDPDRVLDFAEAMELVRMQRLRDGAFQWHLFHDLSRPGRHIETYFVESWAEHMRQHERVTVADKMIEERALSFHKGELPPAVNHYLSAYASRRIEEPDEDPNRAASPVREGDYRFLLRM